MKTWLQLGLGAALVTALACGSDDGAKDSSADTEAAGAAAAGGTAAAGSGGSSAPRAAAPRTELPCDVSTALKKNCQSCHGASPIGGAPMSLVTRADLMKPAFSAPSMKVHELARARLHDTVKPMPPGGMISAEDRDTLDAWLGDGAQPATDAAPECAVPPEQELGEPATGTMDPLVALPGETCYEFKTHASRDSVDNLPYQVAPGESYVDFYFRAPWPDGSVATRYGAKFDNLKVLHHWLLFSTDENRPEGSWSTSALPTLAGLGASLLAGWAVGGVNVEMPADTGFELPPKGKQINVQWHFYNTTSEPAADATSVQICTVPAGTRAKTATMTWTGSENLGGNKWFGGSGMPPHQKSTFQGTCRPQRQGMNATDPIHIIAFWPHLHQLGTSMQAYVNHKDGSKEKIFDRPFDFNHQIHYMQPYDLQPGDTLTSVCNFDNTTDHGVPYGESSDTEMCYLFVMSTPAHALENHVSSLIGATNTCW